MDGLACVKSLLAPSSLLSPYKSQSSQTSSLRSSAFRPFFLACPREERGLLTGFSNLTYLTYLGVTGFITGWIATYSPFLLPAFKLTLFPFPEGSLLSLSALDKDCKLDALELSCFITVQLCFSNQTRYLPD